MKSRSLERRGRPRSRKELVWGKNFSRKIKFEKTHRNHLSWLVERGGSGGSGEKVFFHRVPKMWGRAGSRDGILHYRGGHPPYPPRRIPEPLRAAKSLRFFRRGCGPCRRGSAGWVGPWVRRVLYIYIMLMGTHGFDPTKRAHLWVPIPRCHAIDPDISTHEAFWGTKIDLS